MHDARDLIDPRQRRAAALLLVGFDLPAPMDGAARQALQAAIADPRLSPADAFTLGRVGALSAARDLIETMLQELAHG